MRIFSRSGFAVEVLQPSQPPIVVAAVGTDDQTAMIAVQPSEIRLIKDLDRENFIRTYPNLQYWELDKQATPIDTLYRETRSPVYKQPFPIPIFIQLEPPKRMLKRFGLEADHEAIGLVSQGWLDRHAPTLKIKTGDRIAYYDTPYIGAYPQPNGLADGQTVREPNPRYPNFSFEVLTSKWTDFFANTQHALHLILTLKNLRAPGKPDSNISQKAVSH